MTTISNIKIHVSKTSVCPQTVNKYKVICAAGAIYGLHHALMDSIKEEMLKLMRN